MARKSQIESPSESDDSSSSSSSVSEQTVKKSKVPESRSGTKTKSKKEPSETSGSDSSSDDEGNGGSSGSESESEDASSQSGKSSSSSPEDESDSDSPREAFRPPAGFKPLKSQRAPSSGVKSILSDLRGKQVFHITAPASLPLSSIKEVSLAKVLSGEPVLEHKGVKYGIPADTISQQDADEKILLAYDEKTQTYYNTSIGNIQSYNLQELVSLPNGTAYNKGKPDTSKPPRPQPKDLKMRFRPVGSTYGPPETIGTSDEESEGEQASFKYPKGSKAEREERKRKHQQTEEAEKNGEVAPRKKSKKHSSKENGKMESSQDAGEGRADKHKKSKHGDEKKRKKAEKAA
ncbi:hypothetical protein Plec18167_000043 [Paecilomyces lecythidis]|uniref:DNA-directed RNA polymerase I subunit RPA34.5 n=1 Tax=Paecilomyces lecythidis TaxID=3004212 RepID=A0ABR3YFA3_9EURO